MAERKIFAGPRLRRIRRELDLTQTAMAEGLGISPSYLNLIERNQRPLTVQLLLKLATVYKVEPDALQGDVAGMGPLREVFADPLLAGEIQGEQELVAFSEAAPNAAAGMVKLYRAYREQARRLTELAELLAREGHETTLSGARLPMDEVRDVMESRPFHFPGIEAAVNSFHAGLEPGDALEGRLKEWLRKTHGIVVRLLPVHVMPGLRRRYDRHSLRLFLSERLSPFDQLREVAMEVALIAFPEAIQQSLADLPLSSGEARRIARFELARYAAHALMMPLAPFQAAAERARYDIDALRSRFRVSYEQAATRLVSLNRPAGGPHFFLQEIDSAGNVLRRAGAEGFPRATFGGQCPKLNLHATFAQPGQVLAEAVTLSNGAVFLTVSRTLEGPMAAFHERPRLTALMLACDFSEAQATVYAEGLSRPVEIGPACRLCERQGCLARAEPPMTRPLGLDEMATGFSLFDFQ
ncbi:short-chain fatty acyl-CoA regulator family protein [Allorhizobium sp. BGMRC 0089]|uniref:helix-turn-helix domain-containing protein n=1 Tax=Allorhizobium sonneratiae TaxID=2934936 RepID=UPI002033C9E7|nr:XRE family transcriptional regulator [Allorhizobium sonneratiae]MCM2291353.1 short-chain fatty acyl-CoA regulator family protein [Allorhizobium sonneratiae]